MRGRGYSIPSPTGGWNTRDSLDKMPEDHAIVMDNYFPDNGKVNLRKGYTSYATGMTSHVEMLSEFHSGTNRKFISAANGNIWDISSPGAATSLASGFTSNRWQTASFNGTMGLVNGTDAPQTYNGTTVGAMTVSGSGLTVTNLVGINVFKSRTYFWENSSQDFWYSSVNALGGTLTKFPLSRVGQFGGNLMAMSTWTRDGGSGMDDYAVFFMTSGEVIIYQGSDPGTDFSIVGVFRIGQPISVRCEIKVSGDTVVATKDGYAMLSKIIGDVTNNHSYISNQISPSVTSAVADYGANYGWQIILFPKENMLIVNVPITTNATYNQHVFNTNTGAPCRFTNIQSRCWGLYNDNMYFGGNGVVYKFYDGLSDNGSYIHGDVAGAPTYIGSRSTSKLVTAAAPSIISDGNIEYSFSVGGDFRIPDLEPVVSSFTASGAEWDVATWDDAEWTGGDKVFKTWHSVGVWGYNFIPRLKTSVKAQNISWLSTNYIYKSGGLI